MTGFTLEKKMSNNKNKEIATVWEKYKKIKNNHDTKKEILFTIFFIIVGFLIVLGLYIVIATNNPF